MPTNREPNKDDLRMAIEELRRDVDKNTTDIARILDEELPELEGRFMAALGRSVTRIEEKIDGVTDALRLPRVALRAVHVSNPDLPPMREETPSRPEIEAIAETKATTIATRVYETRKLESIRARADKRERTEDEIARDQRNFRYLIVASVAAAIVGSLATGFATYYATKATNPPPPTGMHP